MHAEATLFCNFDGPGKDPQPSRADDDVPGEYEAGGGGLYGTAPDYLTFLRMLLGRGQFGTRRILKPETVDLMWSNHIGDVEVTRMETLDPVTASLLQARLVELGTGLRLVPGLYEYEQ